MKSNNNYPVMQLMLYMSLKKYCKYISVFLCLVFLIATVSCSYYTVKDVATTQETIAETVKNFNEHNKYAIIHVNGLQWHLQDLVLDDDEQTIQGTLALVSEEHQFPLKTKISHNNRKRINGKTKETDSVSYKVSSRDSKKVHRYNKDKEPLNEVHFYLNDMQRNFQSNQNILIPLSEIDRISINDKNTGRTVANIFAGTVGTAVFATLLILALKSSCPFVYIKNDEEFNFIGELYPGTITPNMQKDDYLPLPDFTPNPNNYYILKITNQLKEIQYTDQIQLITVSHDCDTEVLLDQNGKPQLFKDIKSPKKVLVDGELGDLQMALLKDHNYYAFNSSVNSKNGTRQLTLEFDKPEGKIKAKLYLTAKNSVWLDYIFGKFNEQFGLYYNTFQKNQQKISGDSIRRWVNGQNIPLNISVKTDNGWKLVEQLNSVGPLAMRDLVVPLDIKGNVSENLEVKLETGFMFWEVDFIGIDYTHNQPLEITYVNPSQAIANNEKDVTNLLIQADGDYFVQPNIGDEVTVSFTAPLKNENTKQTVFLKNRGYYNYIRDYKGIPNFEKLKTFREDNAFTKFSEKAYFEYVNFDFKTLAYHE